MMKTVILAFSLVAFPAMAFAQDQEQKPLDPLTQEKLKRYEVLLQIETLMVEAQSWRQLFADTAKRRAELEVALQNQMNRDFLADIAKDAEAKNPGYKFDLEKRSLVKKSK